jgi:hypothetical protein
MFYEWTVNTVHENAFVLVDSAGAEVAGLGDTFSVEIRKPGGSFVAAVGSKSEISDGWYVYTNTTAEADTVGPLAIKITGAGVVQQNLVAVVGSLLVAGREVTYTVRLDDELAGDPIEGVTVRVRPQGSSSTVFIGTTDEFGVLRDSAGELPYLGVGSWEFYRSKVGYTFSNPDVEVIT